MENQDLIQLLKTDFEIDLQEQISLDKLKEILSEHINLMIRSDFQKLVSVLYRVDVSETKLKKLLEENTDTDAASMIADLIIERQLQKIKSRRQFDQRDENISDDEKW